MDMRRIAAAIVSALLLVGCELVDGGGQRPGDMLPDGSIVINRGQLNGRPWGAFAVQRGAEVCIVYEGGALAGRTGSCTSNGMGGGMSAEWGGGTSIAEGFSAPNGVVVRVTTNTGAFEVPAVPLDRLGVQATAFVVVLPGDVEPRRLIVVDELGQTTDEFVMGP